jgi:hypothetical protein
MILRFFDSGLQVLTNPLAYSVLSLQNCAKLAKRNSMGRGRKGKTQKMKNRKRQTAKKARTKKRAESVRKSRSA